MAPPSTPTARSPSRLRSKTSDLSDLLHGRSSRTNGNVTDTEIPPMPQMASSSAPETTPSKPKRKLAGFLARKRKSGIIGGGDSHREEEWTPVEDYCPAVPDALRRRCDAVDNLLAAGVLIYAPTSRIPSNPASSSLPTSLPPLNVSPTAFSTHFPSASPTTDVPSPQRNRLSSALGISDTSNNSSVPTSSSATRHLSTSIPFRNIRPQKSTSFEVSSPFNATHMATASNMAMLSGHTAMQSVEPKAKSFSSTHGGSKKPVITISAPPGGTEHERERDLYIAPRNAPTPPSSASPSKPSSQSAREKDQTSVAPKRSLGFGFGHNSSKKDRDNKDDGGSIISDRERSLKDAKQKERDSKQRSFEKDKRREIPVPLPSPTPSMTPVLPSRMQFPIPPAYKTESSELTLGTGAQIVPTLTDAFQMSSPATSSLASISPHTATPSTSEIGNDKSPGRSHSNGLGVPLRPLRPMSLIIPGSVSPRPRANSANTLTATSIRSLNQPGSPASSGPGSSPTNSIGRPSFPPSSRLRAQRTVSSRSPSPASPPPRSPLPSPPVSTASFPVSSDAEGWSTDASASTRLGYGGWSTDASTKVGSGCGKKLALSSGARIRANTITSVGGPRVGVHGYGYGYRHASGVSSGEETPFDEAASERLRQLGSAGRKAIDGMPNGLPPFAPGQKDKKEKEEKLRVDTIVSALVPATRPSSAQSQAQCNSQDTGTTRGSTAGGPAAIDDSNLRAAHDTFVRILQERHAAEKAELLKRIERLEREARKREREIKGLRWLVLNASGSNGGDPASLIALDEQLASGRLRSGSKSSQVSGQSTKPNSEDGSNFSPAALRARAAADVYGSLPDSQYTEEPGELIAELQSAVSDLIAPAQTYSPPRANATGERPDSPGSGAILKRSNTAQDPAHGPLPSKAARRTSSPVLPSVSSASSSKLSVQHGLGFDIPSIPGTGSDMSLATMAHVDSVPSLTATNTASSTSSLSAIPEIYSASESSMRELEQQKEQERLEKEERRASRALKRISASSTLSSAPTSYSANLKVGMSPSIGQVLDRTRDLDANVDEAGMDEVLRKLRAFGSGGTES